jgi:Ran-binding protein 3
LFFFAASSAGGLAFGSSAPAAPAAPSVFGSAAPTGTLLFGAGSGAGAAAAPAAAPAAGVGAELPPAGLVQTGEEGETTVFSAAAKLYHFNPIASEWSLRGVGPLKINTSSENGRARVVMRQRDTLKLLLNANLWSGMNLAPMEGAANVS